VIISSGLTRSLLTIAHRLLRHATANSRMLMRSLLHCLFLCYGIGSGDDIRGLRCYSERHGCINESPSNLDDSVHCDNKRSGRGWDGR
jgi:hypothetical protein